jgi:LysR family glycine cleavage system transcriptional activator
MAIDAAVDGQGIALARTTLASWDLLNGRLVMPLTVALKATKTYWIVCPKATAKLPKIEIFRNWLLAEVAEDERQLTAKRTSKRLRRTGSVT